MGSSAYNKPVRKTRIMAIDFGDVRTGVAVSDESATLTGDAWVINEKRRDVLAGLILDEVISRNVGIVVVGYPKNMDGTSGFRAKATEEFAENLRDLLCREVSDSSDFGQVDIVFWDERLTTKMADNLLKSTGKQGASRKRVTKGSTKRKNSIDAVAAALILESYISGL